MKTYAVDVDMNGTLDPISTAFWANEEGEMTEYPINYLDELVVQVSVITKKYSNYKSFSYATIHDILDESVMNRVVYEFKMNTTSSCILWNDQGKFRWEELPDMAQVSPITETVVYDINQDGLLDAILAGNDYTFDVSTGYYDANKGLVLLSDQGKPLSKLQTPSESGLLLQGMVESTILIEDVNPMLIVGFNRAQTKAFRINRQP
jgi:hypothetical protein